MNVVLLIDDPPNPDDPHNLALLESARALPAQINDMLAARRASGSSTRSSSSRRASSHAARSRSRACGRSRPTTSRRARSSRRSRRTSTRRTPTEKFVRNEVIGGLANDLTTVAGALQRAADEGATLPPARMVQLYRRLVLDVPRRGLELRAQALPSLSHEANKAMNLNSYIGLMGGSYLERADAGAARCCVPARGAGADLVVPDARLRAHPRRRQRAAAGVLPAARATCMEQPENAARRGRRRRRTRAFPGAATRIERIAGATTDLQHIVHQGMTLLRRDVLGRRQRRHPQARAGRHRRDRAPAAASRSAATSRTAPSSRTPSRASTSAIHGWTLLQLPRAAELQRHAAGLRLAVHPAPALGQRRPADPAEAARQLAARQLERGRDRRYRRAVPAGELPRVDRAGQPRPGVPAARTRSTASCSARSCCSTALPYFVAMAGDLKRCGYKRHGRLPHLRLQPDPAAGQPGRRRQVDRSRRSAAQKIAFARTPKVRNRTTAGDLVRARALRDHRVLAVHDLARRAPGGLHARRLRRR